MAEGGGGTKLLSHGNWEAEGEGKSQKERSQGPDIACKDTNPVTHFLQLGPAS